MTPIEILFMGFTFVMLMLMLRELVNMAFAEVTEVIEVILASTVVKVSDEEGVRTITLDDPSTRNALSLPMLHQLRRALGLYERQLRCVVIRARGPVFCSGHSYEEIVAGTRSRGVMEAFRQLVEDLKQSPVPVVAAVDGAVISAGCQLVAACDLVVATSSATFSTPGVRKALLCSSAAASLSRALPRKVAAMMLLTGRPLSAQRALKAGLVSVVVPSHQLERETKLVVNSIMQSSRLVMVRGKSFYKQLELQEHDVALRVACEEMEFNTNTSEGWRNLCKFVEEKATSSHGASSPHTDPWQEPEGRPYTTPGPSKFNNDFLPERL